MSLERPNTAGNNVKITTLGLDVDALLRPADKPGPHIWWTADLHLNHVNIIAAYCPDRLRRFETLEAMNAAIVHNWNSRVAPNDTVVLVGDAVMGPNDRVEATLRQLTGRIILVEGNHDRAPSARRRILKSIAAEVHRRAELTIEGIGNILVQHNPSRELAVNYALQLCGHVHHHWTKSDNIINVGVDVWDFRPVTLCEILSRIDLRVSR